MALLFLTNGAVPANLVPLFPSIKSGLGLSNAQFGFAIAAGPIGALCSGLLAGMLIRRFRSSRVAVTGMIAATVCALLAGIAPSWALLAGSLFLLGAIDSVVDVGQNSHGLRVQRRYGRSILNSFHAIWSIGAVLGALMGGVAAGLGIPVPIHLTISAAIFTTVNLIGYRFLLPGPEPAAAPEQVLAGDGPASRTRNAVRLGTWATLIALGVIAVSGSIVEDAGNSWAAVYLSGSLGAGATIAAFGFVALAGMQFVGRIIGDRLVDRFGQRAVARTGGAITADRNGPGAGVPVHPGHHHRVRCCRVRYRHPGSGGHARGRPAARLSRGHRADSAELDDAAGVPAVPTGGRVDRGRDEPAGGPAAGAALRVAGRRSVAGVVVPARS